ncbi:MAG TPA: glycerophosphoryl diester phosphodiesterase membrane domain-containing protein [Roseiflexaceae bacterium]|nr:glycerophosphoryl diester phosphodiesterase membrane domain-containing protein [Roseiflexaceae bacterium]
MNATTLLRPMTIGDMFDAAFRLYREHFLTFIGIGALLQVPMAIIQFTVQFVLGGAAMQDVLRFSARPPGGQNPFAAFPFASFATFYLITLGLGAFQYLIVRNLATGALANAISRSYHGEPTSILGAYSFGVRRYVALILASLVPLVASLLVAGLIVGCSIGVLATLGVRPGERPNIGLIIVAVLGLMFLVLLIVVASIFVYTRLLLTPQAIVLEDHAAWAGIRRSWRLVEGSFWRTLAIMLLMGILIYLISALPAGILSFSLTLANRGSPSGLIFSQAISALVAEIGVIIALPLQLAVYTLLYYDLRVRKEGYDIEIMAQQAGQS